MQDWKIENTRKIGLYTHSGSMLVLAIPYYCETSYTFITICKYNINFYPFDHWWSIECSILAIFYCELYYIGTVCCYNIPVEKESLQERDTPRNLFSLDLNQIWLNYKDYDFTSNILPTTNSLIVLALFESSNCDWWWVTPVLRLGIPPILSIYDP